MKRVVSLFLLLAYALFSSVSYAEKYDFSNYTLENLIEMRTELDSEIANKTVKNNSTLTSAQSFDGEILFRNIPWGTDAKTVLQKLYTDGMANNNTDIDNNDYMYAWELSESTDIFSSAGANISLYEFPNGFNVAGYPLSQVQVYCPYSYTFNSVDRDIENTQLMFVTMKFDITDIELVYSDLVNKLSSLYGTPEEVVDNNSYYLISNTTSEYTQYNTWMVWTGANSTGVFLYKKYQIEKGNSTLKYPELTLAYGKLDGKAYLSNLSNAKKEEKKAQDAIIQQQNSNNVDGL